MKEKNFVQAVKLDTNIVNKLANDLSSLAVASGGLGQGSEFRPNSRNPSDMGKDVPKGIEKAFHGILEKVINN